MEKGGIIKHDQDKAPKTGDWRYMKPEIDAAKCIGCTTCVPHCPEAVMEMKERETQDASGAGSTLRVSNYASIDYEYCKGCGVCAQVCPVKAIVMKK